MEYRNRCRKEMQDKKIYKMEKTEHFFSHRLLLNKVLATSFSLMEKLLAIGYNL